MIYYGFFTTGLEDKTYYWEIVLVNFKKIVFIMASTLMAAMPSEFKVRSYCS